MSKNVKVNGVDYFGISNVQLAAAEGGTVTFVDADEATGGGGEKILYMDAELLNAGGAYPVDADDYTTAVIPAEATFVDVDAFVNLPNLDTLIVNGDCEFEVYEETEGKGVTYYSPIVKHLIPIRKLVVQNRTAYLPNYFMNKVGTLCEVETSAIALRNAFEGCTYLKKVELKNIENTEINTFSGCSGLSEVTIPDSVTGIGSGSFSGCSRLTEITIPDSVNIIAESAFYFCNKLTKVIIPDSVTVIGAAAFRGCGNLTKASIPDGVATMGNSVFSGCAKLTEVNIPKSLTSIETETFYGCSSLMEITVPANVASIGTYAFDACAALETITILGMETTIADTTSIPSTTTIRAYAGSAAETFATENGYTFEAIE